MKGAVSLDAEVVEQRAALGRRLANWSIDHRFHHGGFSRHGPELDGFLYEFDARHRFRPDHVYVGEMMFGLFAIVKAGELPASSVVVAVVTGAVTDLGLAAPQPG